MKKYYYHYYTRVRKNANPMKYESVRAHSYEEAKRIAEMLHPNCKVFMDTPKD